MFAGQVNGCALMPSNANLKATSDNTELLPHDYFFAFASGISIMSNRPRSQSTLTLRRRQSSVKNSEAQATGEQPGLKRFHHSYWLNLAAAASDPFID